jgi:hypothetical protein
MPTLALITACERSIIEQDTKSVSLISLFTGVKISIQAEEPPPVNAIVAKEWSIACGWDGRKDEEGQVFDQLMDIYLPDGKPFVTRNQVKFSVQVGKRQFLTSKLAAFPIGQPGKCMVQVWAELDGKLVTDRVSISISIEHERLALSHGQPQPT